MSETRKRHDAIVTILKHRFVNLTVEEVNKLAWDILEAIE